MNGACPPNERQICKANKVQAETGPRCEGAQPLDSPSTATPTAQASERPPRPKPPNPNPLRRRILSKPPCRRRNPAAGAGEAPPRPPATTTRTSRARHPSRPSSSPTASRSNSAPSPSSVPRYFPASQILRQGHLETPRARAPRFPDRAPLLPPRRCCCRWCTCR